MRANRSGRIVNISSVTGVVSLPFLGFYCASKFAMEGLSDAMRLELKPFGIDVCIAQPAAIASEFAHVTHDQARAPSDAYARWYRPDALRDASKANAAPVDVAIDAIVKMCLSPISQARVAFSARGRRMIAMQRWLSHAQVRCDYSKTLSPDGRLTGNIFIGHGKLLNEWQLSKRV